MKNYGIFDIVGPNMIGPSSSHTAGACRIGYVAHRLAGGEIKKATFLLHGSFGKTYKGHGTDKALLGGILGFNPDDERIKYSFDLAREKGIDFRFIEEDLGEVHPNTTKVLIEKIDGTQMEVLGSSIGGGSIKITEINGLELEFTGEYPTLIIAQQDRAGVIAKVTTILARYNVNVAFMRVYRHSKGEDAFMIIELDEDVSAEVLEPIQQIEEVSNAYLISLK